MTYKDHEERAWANAIARAKLKFIAMDAGIPEQDLDFALQIYADSLPRPGATPPPVSIESEPAKFFASLHLPPPILTEAEYRDHQRFYGYRS